MNKKFVALFFAIALGVVIVAGVISAGNAPQGNTTAMTELNVGNLSCGSCVSNIQRALGEIDGIGQVDVSVTNGRSKVLYDPELIEATAIAEAVTQAGYPATVRTVLDAAEYDKLQNESDQLSDSYVARVGNRLVSRADFDQTVDLRGGTDVAGSPSPYTRQQVEAQVWKELKEREILLAAAEVNQIVIQDGEVNLEIERMKAGIKDFDSAVTTRFGGYDRYFTQVKENMIINRNIEQNVFANLANDADKQQRFSQWYADLQQEIDVVIFDPALKQTESAAGSGCGSGSGSCCGSKS